MKLFKEVKNDLDISKRYVYAIYNKITQDIYIGSTKRIKKRLNEHISKLKNKAHCNRHLQFSFNKYGLDNFDLYILKELNIDENMFFEEQKYLFKFMSFGFKIYNSHFIVAEGIKHHNEKAKSKIAKASKGRKMSEATRLKLSLSKMGDKNPMYKSTISDEERLRKKLSKTGLNASDAKKGVLNGMYGRSIIPSAETRKKISDSKKGFKNPMYGKTGNLHHNYGKKYSQERIERMREISKNMSEETKKKMSEAKLNYSPEKKYEILTKQIITKIKKNPINIFNNFNGIIIYINFILRSEINAETN